MATAYRNSQRRHPPMASALPYYTLPSPLCSQIAQPIFSREAVSERPIIEESKLVLRIERQLDHALEKLIPRNAAKISQHELLDIEP